MAKQKQPARTGGGNTFFGGAAILAVGIMVTKIIGLFYKFPLTDIIGAQGVADFNNSYYIYSVLLTISTAGLPVAVSKMVSEARTLGRYGQVRQVFRLSLGVFLGLGVVSFLVMYFGAEQLAGLMNDSLAAEGIRALAPAVICVGCLSAFRGYAQGHGRMSPTAVSQILEALCKLFVGLGLAFWIVSVDGQPHMAAAGAITGVTVGTIFALVYMILDFVHTRLKEDVEVRDQPDGPRRILTTLLAIAIPITLSSSMVGIITVIDSSLVQGQLQRALLTNPDSWTMYQEYVDFAPLKTALDAWSGSAVKVSDFPPELQKLAEDLSRTLYGNYGSAMNLYNLPLSLMAALTASVIPAVSARLTARDKKGAARISTSALRMAALLAFPAGVGLFVLGTPIIQLVFPKMQAEIAGPLLSTLGIASLFVCMMLVCNSVLQAYGFINLPVTIMVLGGVVKILTNYNVVARPGVGIYGAPYGNVLCFGLCMLLDLLLMSRVIPNCPKFPPLFLKPAIAAGAMGLAAWAVYGLAFKLLHSNLLSVALSILAAVAVYGGLVIALGAIEHDDLMLMPKGEKIAKILHL